MRILLVDDEPLALKRLEETVKKVLPEADCHAFLRANEALSYAYNNAMDIAFLDISMRTVDGITMARQLQEHYSRMNVIFCTGYSGYALDAVGVYCSAYLLKPITEEKVQEALEHLRYPLTQNKRIEMRCFGNFQVLCGGEPIHFKYSKAAELLAYLVDRNGADITTREAMELLFGGENKVSYFGNIRMDLLDTLTELGERDILRMSRGKLGLERDKVSCDYFDYLAGARELFRGEYMAQYDFAKGTRKQLFLERERERERERETAAGRRPQ